MPIYEYECIGCGGRFELRRSMPSKRFHLSRLRMRQVASHVKSGKYHKYQ